MRNRKIIAVDFDGTLVENEYPEIGATKAWVVEKLKEEIRNGAMVILWTCREGKYLEDAVNWCSERGIEFDAVNDNIICVTKSFGTNPRKIFANEYWDDRAVKI